MKTKELLRKVEGIHTIESVMDILKISKARAVYYIHRLKKEGYVKTHKTPAQKRVYSISFENKAGGKSYYDILNKHAPMQLAEPLAATKFHGGGPNVEETLVYAVKSGSNRIVCSSLALFPKIKSWSRLHKLAKKENIVREIAALYFLARRIMRVKRMDRRFFGKITEQKPKKYKYVAEHERSDDYKDIEKEWKVYIPFNKADLEEYLHDIHKRAGKSSA